MKAELKHLIDLSKAYRKFLLELGDAFKEVKDTEAYGGFADTFIDCVKSPEVGFSVAEANNLIKMYDMFCMLEVDELPPHHSMKLMTARKVDMDLLESAQTLSVTDFKELLDDKKLDTQERTYKYEVIKRSNTGSIKRVYGEELEEAINQIKDEPRL